MFALQTIQSTFTGHTAVTSLSFQDSLLILTPYRDDKLFYSELITSSLSVTFTSYSTLLSLAPSDSKKYQLWEGVAPENWAGRTASIQYLQRRMDMDCMVQLGTCSY